MSYAQDVGSFVCNMGAIEHLTYAWVQKLSRDEIVVELATNMDLKPRIDLIKKLINRSDRLKDWRDSSLADWADVSGLITTRNALCHNPLLLSWMKPDESAKPDAMRTPLVKKIMRSEAGQEKMVDSAELDGAVRKSGALAQKLFLAISENKP